MATEYSWAERINESLIRVCILRRSAAEVAQA
jgi:hypothetical protein